MASRTFAVSRPPPSVARKMLREHASDYPALALADTTVKVASSGTGAVPVRASGPVTPA
ncbi:hypothetical protein [Actinoplanes sp. NPDC051411]|uniref:hypothetical protein n=1 Tax=Actinoplanes sp. NPDC051411 TaxID=3155522 RepID=UPI00343B38BC